MGGEFGEVLRMAWISGVRLVISMSIPAEELEDAWEEQIFLWDCQSAFWQAREH